MKTFHKAGAVAQIGRATKLLFATGKIKFLSTKRFVGHRFESCLLLNIMKMIIFKW